MAEDKGEEEQAFVAKWLKDQEQWQRTFLSYLDSMVKNEDFLVHLGNAMRGSLLAGKPYPGTPQAATSTPTESASDARLDQILFALRNIEGQLHDLTMTLDELRKNGKRPPAARIRKRKGK